MLLWSGQVALLEQNVLPGSCDFRVFVFVNSNRTGLLVSKLGSAGVVVTSVTVATAAAVMRFPTATGGGIVMGSTVVVIASMVVVRMIVVMR